MGYLAVPFMAVIFCLGMTWQSMQSSQNLGGSGTVGRMASLASVTASEAESFAAACMSSAAGIPGLITSTLTVTMPTGVLAPAHANCMTEANGSGRFVYAYMPSAPGAAGQVMTDTGLDASWYIVAAAGQATNLATGQTATIPSTIPTGSILAWLETSS